MSRVEDGFLLAAADTTAWLLGDEATAVSLLEQSFAYDFDQDGVDNIVEIERGTSPTSLSLDFDADGLPDDSDADNDGVAGIVSMPFRLTVRNLKIGSSNLIIQRL